MLEISHIGRYMYKYMNLMSTSLSQIQLSQHDGIIVIIANVFQLSQMCHEGFFLFLECWDFQRLPKTIIDFQ